MDKRGVLRDNRLFRRVYSKGSSRPGPVLVTYVLKNKSDAIRYGIATSRKIGGAVQRNRARRVIRAAFRDLASSLAGGCDIVFVARSKTCLVKSTAVKKEMERQLREAGVLR